MKGTWLTCAAAGALLLTGLVTPNAADARPRGYGYGYRGPAVRYSWNAPRYYGYRGAYGYPRYYNYPRSYGYRSYYGYPRYYGYPGYYRYGYPGFYGGGMYLGGPRAGFYFRF